MAKHRAFLKLKTEKNMLTKSNVELKIYLSGSISHNENAYDDFFKAEEEVKRIFPNAIVFNPIRLGKLFANFALQYSEMMQICMMFLSHSDAVYMLNNHHHSNGATEELHRAISLNKRILYQSNMTEDGYDIT